MTLAYARGSLLMRFGCIEMTPRRASFGLDVPDDASFARNAPVAR